MRSTFKTIAVAAFSLSVGAGGAFAAGHSHHGDHHHPMQAVTENSGDFDYSTVEPSDAPATMVPMVHHARLDRVLGELGSAQRSIRRDEATHRLSASAYRRLEGEAGGIRSRAMAVADTHNGAIPEASYQRLQKDIRKLDRDIVRLS